MSHRDAPVVVRRPTASVQRCQQRPISHVAAEMEISRACASKWVNRWRRHGELGLHDRPSTPHHSPDATPARVIERIETWRRVRRSGRPTGSTAPSPPVAEHLGMHASYTLICAGTSNVTPYTPHLMHSSRYLSQHLCGRRLSPYEVPSTTRAMRRVIVLKDRLHGARPRRPLIFSAPRKMWPGHSGVRLITFCSGAALFGDRSHDRCLDPTRRMGGGSVATAGRDASWPGTSPEVMPRPARAS
jgi:hypothetical protein